MAAGLPVGCATPVSLARSAPVTSAARRAQRRLGSDGARFPQATASRRGQPHDLSEIRPADSRQCVGRSASRNRFCSHSHRACGSCPGTKRRLSRVRRQTDQRVPPSPSRSAGRTPPLPPPGRREPELPAASASFPAPMCGSSASGTCSRDRGSPISASGGLPDASRIAADTILSRSGGLPHPSNSVARTSGVRRDHLSSMPCNADRMASCLRSRASASSVYEVVP